MAERIESAGGMRADKFSGLGLTFDDVLLVPAASSVLPNEVITDTRIAGEITLNAPILSSAMDTVTEGRMAIALAREGGLGVIHRNLSIEDQIAEVDKVKRTESGMIVEPVTLTPESPLSRRPRGDGALSHLRRADHRRRRRAGRHPDQPRPALHRLRRPADRRRHDQRRISSPRRSAHRSIRRARSCIDTRSKNCPSLTSTAILTGLITVKDIQKHIQFPNATKDSQGRLAGCAPRLASGPMRRARARRSSDEDVDLLVVDTAHGHASSVRQTVRATQAPLAT